MSALKSRGLASRLQGELVRLALPALLVLLKLACAPPPRTDVTCETSCGLRGVGVADCDGLERQEWRARDAYARHVDGWSWRWSCRRLEGWAVYVHASEDGAPVWYSPRHGQAIGGQTFCGLSAIEVASEDWGRNALAHELGHALELCADPEHERWGEKGMFAAIGEATGP